MGKQRRHRLKTWFHSNGANPNSIKWNLSKPIKTLSIQDPPYPRNQSNKTQAKIKPIMSKTLILIIDLDTIMRQKLKTCTTPSSLPSKAWPCKPSPFHTLFPKPRKMVLNPRFDDSFYKVILLQFALLLVHVSGYENDKNDFTNFRPGRLYFAIAASPSGQTYSRAFNKTLMNITQSYLTTKVNKDTFNFTLETLVIELPENGSFSAALLRNLCNQFEGKHVVAVLIVGDSPAAFTVSLTAKHSGIPVLWARGHSGFLPGLRSLVSDLFMYRRGRVTNDL